MSDDPVEDLQFLLQDLFNSSVGQLIHEQVERRLIFNREGKCLYKQESCDQDKLHLDWWTQCSRGDCS